MDCKIDGVVTDVKSVPLLGLKNSRTEVWLLMTRLGTLLKLKGTHIQKEKQSLDG
jgi:hypothetical protein